LHFIPARSSRQLVRPRLISLKPDMRIFGDKRREIA